MIFIPLRDSPVEVDLGAVVLRGKGIGWHLRRSELKAREKLSSFVIVLIQQLLGLLQPILQFDLAGYRFNLVPKPLHSAPE
jgi:hypothetical protein